MLFFRTNCLLEADFSLWYFPTVEQDPSVSKTRCFSFTAVYYSVGFLQHTPPPIWQYSKIFAFRSVHSQFQDSWTTGISYSSLLSNLPNPLTPYSNSCLICGVDPPSQHPASAGRVPRGAVLQNQSPVKQIKPLHVLPVPLSLLKCSGFQILCILSSKTLRVDIKSSLRLSARSYKWDHSLPL